MNELDTSQAAPQEDTQQANPTTNDELVALLNAEDAGTDEGEQPSGEQPDDDEADDEAPADEGKAKADAKALADEAEVPLDDGRKVSVRELKETFSTFTRKTQELAESQRNTLAQAREAVAGYAERQAHELHLIAQSMDQLVAPGFDDQALQRLAFEDPQQFYQVKARLDYAAQQRTKIQAQVQEHLSQAQQQRALAQQEQQQAHAELLQTEGAKLTGQKWYTADFQGKAVAFARKHGIPEQIARGVAYAGFVDITRKAMLYDDAMQRAKAGKQPPKAQGMAPGSTPARGALGRAKETKGLYERAAKSGDKRDFGAFLDRVL